MFPYIRSATILNTNTTTNKIPIHLMNLNATLIPKYIKAIETTKPRMSDIFQPPIYQIF